MGVAERGAREGTERSGARTRARRPAAARGRVLGSGGDSTAAAADSGGEKLGEREEVAVELTEGSFWAGNGRRWKLGVEGRSSGKTAMAGDNLSSILAGFGYGRARGWSEWVDGEVA